MKFIESSKRFLEFLCVCGSFVFSVSASAGEWIDTKQSQNIAYFLFDSPAVIKRYDLQSEAFLSDIEFSTTDTSTAFNVDDQGLYVAFGRRVSRFLLDGSGEVHLTNTLADITDVLASAQYLFIHYDDSGNGHYLTSLNKQTGAVIVTRDYHTTMGGLIYSAVVGKIFARTRGRSPSDIVEVSVDADGMLSLRESDSPYHGAYPSGTKTFLFPGELRVSDNSGIVYATSDLTYNNSLAGSYDDLVFNGDTPIVLRNNTLFSYSNTFIETGQFNIVGIAATRILFFGGTVYSFGGGANPIDVVKTSFSSLTPDIPGLPINPTGLPYQVDEITIGNDNIIYILSKANLSIFRWSIETGGYLESIPLLGSPLYFSYSSENHTIYLAYASGKIDKINLDAGFTEVPFVNSPQRPVGLATAGQFVFVVDPTGAWVSHFTYSSAGQLISQVEWNYESDEYIWNEVNRKMYFFRDHTSPRDLYWENIDTDGQIGTKKDTPYHSSSGIIHPIKVSPDGTEVLLGSGRIYDGISLELTGSLSNDIVDALWSQGNLFTLRETASATEIQKWTQGNSYALNETIAFSGSPRFLLQTSIDSKRWFFAIVNQAGIPGFRDSDLSLWEIVWTLTKIQ